MQHVSHASIGSLFSAFGLTSKTKPSDNSICIIFIVGGGVTANEIREIKELVAKQKKTQIVIGSSCLLTGENLLKLIFRTQIATNISK